MRVALTHVDGACQATLSAETDTDRTFLDAVDLERTLLVDGMDRERLYGVAQNTTLHLTLNATDPRALRADAGRQVLGALGQLFRLGLREAAYDVHAGATPTDPQAQEELAARLVQLQVVSQAGSAQISKREALVEKVIGTHGTTVADALKPPRIGQPWPGQGGTYAGIMRGAPGQSDYHLIVAATDAVDDEVTFGNRGTDIEGATSEWDGAANTKALIEHGGHPAASACAAVEVDGHADFHLPSRRELALCFANVGDLFDAEGYYWSSTQLSAHFAFVQYFQYGGSGWNFKGYERRVRACRGLPLHPFNTSKPAAPDAAEGGSL